MAHSVEEIKALCKVMNIEIFRAGGSPGKTYVIGLFQDASAHNRLGSGSGKNYDEALVDAWGEFLRVHGRI